MPRQQQETELALALFDEQQRRRAELARAEAARWLAIGAVVASVALFLLWQWRLLPGPWQWFATAQRPAELLWAPLLFALGGYWARWNRPPSLREAAWRLDRRHDSSETVLTAADWLLSDAPRSANSARVLERAMEILAQGPQSEPAPEDSGRTGRVALLRSFAALLLPLALLALFWVQEKPEMGATHFSSRAEVERLETLLEEHLGPEHLDAERRARLESLLEKLKDGALPSDPAELESLVLEAEKGAAKERALRDLLESLAERAGRGEALSERDKQALETAATAGPDLAETLAEAQQRWAAGEHGEAREQLQEAQAHTGRQARALTEASRTLREGAAQERRSADHGQSANSGGDPAERGEGTEETGTDPGDRFAHGDQGAQTSGQTGTGQADFGVGTSDEESTQEGGTLGQQSQRRSHRTSEWEEQFRRLHSVEESTHQSERTRVLGELDESGQTYLSEQSGRGAAAVEPGYRPGDALLEARQDAENALLREQVPAQRAEAVRRYFDPR